MVLDTFLLKEGIGFVWIIRVFLLIALVTPFLLYAQKNFNMFWILIGCLAILAFLDMLITNGIGMDKPVIFNYVYYCMGYAVPFICGLIFPKLKFQNQIIFTIGSLLFLIIDAGLVGLRHGHSTFLDIFINGNPFIFNNFKYPPQSYFLLYGVVMSAILYLMIVKGKVYRYLTIFEFIGCNTIWLYLYHIPLIQLTGKLGLHWAIRYFIVYFLAFILTYAQVKLIEKIQAKHSSPHYFNFLKG